MNLSIKLSAPLSDTKKLDKVLYKNTPLERIKGDDLHADQDFHF